MECHFGGTQTTSPVYKPASACSFGSGKMRTPDPQRSRSLEVATLAVPLHTGRLVVLKLTQYINTTPTFKKLFVVVHVYRSASNLFTAIVHITGKARTCRTHPVPDDEPSNQIFPFNGRSMLTPNPCRIPVRLDHP